jgi:hypothetical protein
LTRQVTDFNVARIDKGKKVSRIVIPQAEERSKKKNRERPDELALKI